MKSKRTKTKRPSDNLIGVFSVFPQEVTRLIWDLIVKEDGQLFSMTCKTFRMYYNAKTRAEFEKRLVEPAFMRSVINAVFARLTVARIMWWGDVFVGNTKISVASYALPLTDDFIVTIAGSGVSGGLHFVNELTKKEVYEIITRGLGDYKVAYVHTYQEKTSSRKKPNWFNILCEMNSAVDLSRFDLKMMVGNYPNTKNIENLYGTVKNLIKIW